MKIEQKAKAYDGNYKTYTELINRLEGVKDAIKKQNYGIAMDILCKPYPEYQIITSTELKESEDEKIWIDPAIDLPKLSGHIDKDSVEYTRTDAFIEKALKFIKTNVDRIVNNQHGVRIGCMDGEFRNYMEGE